MDDKNASGHVSQQDLETWVAPAPVQHATLTRNLQGKHCSLEPLNEGHLDEVISAFENTADEHWDYLPYGPMRSEEDYQAWLNTLLAAPEAQFPYVIRNASHQVVGLSAYLRIQPEHGVIEIGHLSFSAAMQRTPISTEALYLMIEAVFLLGYRRCEWKCNALNTPSINAASRLGFLYEGTFRQAMIVKQRNRDTAWFSIIDGEWPLLKTAFEQWLSDENFDEHGRQKVALSSLTSAFRAAKKT